jgi:IclR family acetate operon transcriptional repressor
MRCWPSSRGSRRDGYSLDEGEQEVGVRCVAVPVQGAAVPVQGALGTLGISVSGPAPRMTSELVDRAIPLLRSAGERFSAEIAERSTA